MNPRVNRPFPPTQQFLIQPPPPTVPPKKRKDPNAPKAASNAYMIFCKARRATLKEEHPELPFGQLGAKLGEIWRNLQPEDKKPFEDQAAADRERYRKEMEQYQNGTLVRRPDDVKKKKKNEYENKMMKKKVVKIRLMMTRMMKRMRKMIRIYQMN